MKDFFDNIFFKIKERNFQWRYKLFIILPIIILLVTIDWTTKSWASKHVPYDGEQKFIPGFLYFKYIINQGSAYGSMSNHPGLVIFLASVITLFCFILLMFSSDYLIILTFAIIFAGSFGNLFGRTWAPTDGHTKNGVIDFLVWDFWGLGTYIFNFADFFVNIGIGFAILALIFYLVELFKDLHLKKKNQDLFEKYNDLKQEIIRIKFEIEMSFWKNKFSNWKQQRSEFLTNIRLLKLERKNLYKQILNREASGINEN